MKVTSAVSMMVTKVSVVRVPRSRMEHARVQDHAHATVSDDAHVSCPTRSLILVVHARADAHEMCHPMRAMSDVSWSLCVTTHAVRQLATSSSLSALDPMQASNWLSAP